MTMTIRELLEKMARIATEARAKLEECNNDTPEERCAEVEREFEAMMDEHDALEGKVQRMRRLEAAEARSNAPDDRRPNGGDGEARGGDNGDGVTIEYRDVFEQAIRHGAATLTDEQRGILMQGRINVPEELRAQSAVTDAAGGFAVPEGFSGEIDQAMALWGPMWDGDIVRELITASGNRIPWPTVDDTGQTGEDHAENAAATDDGSGDAVFAEKQLDAYVHDTKVVRVPIELLQDSAVNMENLLADLFGERLGRRSNTALTTGTGASQPNGIVTASSLGHNAAAAGAIASDELLDLQHSVDPAYRQSPKARWMFNDDTLKAIRKLKDGDGNYLWQMGDIRSGEPSTILEYPYSVNQAMAGIATGNKSMLFGDFNKYVVRKVIQFQLLTLRERYAEHFQIGMIAFRRFDGELINTAAVKHLIQA